MPTNTCCKLVARLSDHRIMHKLEQLSMLMGSNQDKHKYKYKDEDEDSHSHNHNHNHNGNDNHENNRTAHKYKSNAITVSNLASALLDTV